MKRILSLAAIIGAAMTMVSCGTYSYLEIVDHKETTAQAMPFTNQYVMTTPFVADLQIIDTTMAEVVITEPFKDYDMTSSLIKLIPNFKRLALTEAIKYLKDEKGMNVDVLLGVLFDVNTIFPRGKNQPGKLEITVRGYPARYTNFRTASENDVNLIWKASQAQHPAENVEALLNAPDNRTTFLKENVQYIR